MYLEIVTPDKTVFTGEIKLIQLPGSLGSFEVLKNHAPLISTLDNGKLRIVENNGKEQIFNVQGGVVEAMDNNVLVLAEKI